MTPVPPGSKKTFGNGRWRLTLKPLALLWLTAPLATWAVPPAATDANTARGVLRAEREAVMSSSVSERIVRMPYREGQSFKKGEVLVSFDCARLDAELRAARAGAAVEARNAKVQTELLEMQATGRADADIAVLKEKERQAQADVIHERMTGCKVVAPFSGRVVETMMRIDESPPPNEKLLRIVSSGPMELHMIVPSKWLSWLRPDFSFTFEVDETGDRLKAKVRRISAAVDAVSQTVKIVASVDKVPSNVLPGMSGQALLNGANPGEPVALGSAPTPAAARSADLPRR